MTLLKCMYILIQVAIVRHCYDLLSHFRLVEVGKPVVVVLTHGAPVVSSVYAKVNALLSAGYAGQGIIYNFMCMYTRTVCNVCPFIIVQRLEMQYLMS